MVLVVGTETETGQVVLRPEGVVCGEGSGRGGPLSLMWSLRAVGVIACKGSNGPEQPDAAQPSFRFSGGLRLFSPDLEEALAWLTS